MKTLVENLGFHMLLKMNVNHNSFSPPFTNEQACILYICNMNNFFSNNVFLSCFQTNFIFKKMQPIPSLY